MLWKTFRAIVIAWIVFPASSAMATNDKVTWKFFCQDPNAKETCVVTNTIYVTKASKEGRKPVGKLIGLNVLYALKPETKDRAPYLSIELPLGVDLRPGAVMKIDKFKEYNLPYLRCTKAGCALSLELSPRILRTMLTGRMMVIGFRGWGGAKISKIEIPLEHFDREFAKYTH